MSLGKIIRKRRDACKLTQDQVAARVGISKPYLSTIETEKVRNPPSDEVLAELERVLGFATGELLRMAHLARTPLDVRQEHEELSARIEQLRGVLRQVLASQGTQETVDPDDLAHRLAGQTSAEMLAVSAGKAVPVINRVAAGYPHHFTDLDYPPSVADEYVRCPDVHDPQAFAARVVGDSMAPRYREGDVVIFAPNTPPRPGEDCFVRFADDHSTTFKRFYLTPEGRIRLQPLNDRYPGETYPPEAIDGLWPAVMRIERLR